MSGGLSVLGLKDDDVRRFLTAKTHIGTAQLDFQMQQYCFKRRSDGVYLIDLKKTWEKLLLAARAIVAIENPAEVCAISSRPYGQRAVLKFASFTGATPIAGRFTPGTFTNQIQAAFREPRLLVVCDPREDHQPVTEASYVNIPVIAFCNTDACLRYVDVAIPCNNKAQHSIGLMWWMLTREVLRMRGSIIREIPWDTMVDLFFYRDPEEAEKEEQTQVVPERSIKEAPEFPPDQWGVGDTAAVQPEVADWSTAAEIPFQSAPAPAPAPAPATDDWASTGTATVGPTTEWGAATDNSWAS
ncbi:small ribosomal subunit protein uS2 [Ornithodoros turicata]|uniref:Small ribosomal subunit protein uS2 n=2 Tax=Ornithodoros TaxID=6937 RepID=RSSA_ORNPR|nr:RecName: Full=Small ribosomal subunit protein uS2; AltName: Full=40S ribosomal protein SA [Ornithodoros parkeri]ABR23483.1 40S ribosomal protein SA [Ornithodoros parkeri]